MLALPPRRRRRRRPLPVADRARASTPTCCRRPRPRVMTAHYVLPPRPSRRQVASRPPRLRRAWTRSSPTPSTAPRRLRDEVGLDPGRVRVIPHGAFDYLTRAARGAAAAGRARGRRGPGDPLLRPAAPLQGDRHPARGVPPARGRRAVDRRQPAHGRRRRCARSPPRRRGRVRFVTRFVDDAEIPAIFRRADLVVLPYRDAEQSGVLYTGLAFGKPMVLSAVGGFPEVAAHGAARLVPPEDPAALAAALGELVGDEAARAELAAAAAARRRRPLLLGRGRPPHARPLPRAAGGTPVIALADRLLGLRRLIVYTHARLPAGAAGAARGCAGVRPWNRATLSEPPRRLADRRRLRRGGGDRRQGRQRARARLPARAACEVIVASDGSADATAERARAAGADLVLELPRGGKVAAQNAAAERAARRDPRLLRRQQRAGRPTPCAAWSSPSPTRRSATSAARSASSTPGGDNLEGAYWRYEMAVREMESALAGVTAGNGAIYAVRARRLHPARALRQPRPLLPVRARQARPALALRARGARRGEDGADDRGRVRPQAADDGRPLGHRRRRRDALARAATRRSTPSRSSRTGCCAT